jgi:hypothetical protein
MDMCLLIKNIFECVAAAAIGLIVGFVLGDSMLWIIKRIKKERRQ